MTNEFSHLKAIFENAPLGVFLTTVTGKIENLNSQLVKMFGYDSVEDIKNSIQDLATDLYKDPLDRMRMLKETKGKNEISVYEVKFKRKDGTLIDARMSIRPYKSPDSDIDYLIGIVEDITEQKRIRDQLTNQENKYHSIFKNSNDALIISIGEQSIEFNKKTRELFEIPDNKETMTISEVSPEFQPDGKLSSQEVKKYLEKAANGEPQKFEWHSISFKGKKLICEVTLSKLDAEIDNCFLSVVCDITKQKEAEKRQRESEERYRSLVNNAPIGILRTNIDGEILFVNNKLAQMGGFESPEEFLQEFKYMPDLYKNKSDRDKVIERLIKGQVVKTILEVNAKGNTTRTVNVVAAPLMNKNQELVSVNTIVEDITEKLELERQLKERDEILFSVVNSFPFELFVTDSSHKIIVQNEFSRKTYGDVLGKSYDELPMFIESIPEWEKDAKKVFKNRVLDYEISSKKEGKKYIFRRIKAPLVINGNIFGIVVMSFDISERKILQKELENHRENLEQLVRERTKKVEELNEQLSVANDEMKFSNEVLQWQNEELENLVEELKQTHQQLVQSEKMASLGVLTAGIAHEINNPVNFISSGLSGLELIVEDILSALKEYSTHFASSDDINTQEFYKKMDETYHISKSIKNLPRLIESMRNGIQRTTEIVKGLRIFSRLDNENKTPSNINELIDSSLVILKNKYKKRIDIIKNFGQFGYINCYPGKLGQVFLNLLLNSIQAIEKKGVIEITTKRETESVIVSIKDNGQGIPEEVAGKIFDPFFTTKPVGEGTGLGLSIVHGIVEEHNGKIEVISGVGRGTEFLITLPRE